MAEIFQVFLELVIAEVAAVQDPCLLCWFAGDRKDLIDDLKSSSLHKGSLHI